MSLRAVEGSAVVQRYVPRSPVCRRPSGLDPFLGRLLRLLGLGSPSLYRGHPLLCLLRQAIGLTASLRGDVFRCLRRLARQIPGPVQRLVSLLERLACPHLGLLGILLPLAGASRGLCFGLFNSVSCFGLCLQTCTIEAESAVANNVPSAENVIPKT